MVFHITNYMRETNVWMIRKMRWILWLGVAGIPIYRCTYWDFLGRRVAWRDHFGLWGSEDEKKEQAENLRADWGYTPRYEPKYSFSLKSRKYEGQTDLEKVMDSPRLSATGKMPEKYQKVAPADVKTMVQINMEHNRQPGVFDYNFGQNFYSHHAEVDQESYLIIGAKGSHYAHQRFENGQQLAKE